MPINIWWCFFYSQNLHCRSFSVLCFVSTLSFLNLDIVIFFLLFAPFFSHRWNIWDALSFCISNCICIIACERLLRRWIISSNFWNNVKISVNFFFQISFLLLRLSCHVTKISHLFLCYKKRISLNLSFSFSFESYRANQMSPHSIYVKPVMKINSVFRRKSVNW